MGIDTKGILVVPNEECKNPFMVTRIIEEVMDKSPHVEKRVSPYVLPITPKADLEINVYAQSRALSFNFKETLGRTEGEGNSARNRAMKVFFDVDSDHKNLGEKSITFMLGNSGKSQEVIAEIMQSLQVEINGSKAYIHPDDSTGKPISISEYLESNIEATKIAELTRTNSPKREPGQPAI